jgi:hypothetical protein
MKIRFVAAPLLLSVCVLTACNHAKTDAQVAKDTNAAEQKALDNVARAEDKASERVADASKNLAADQRDVQHVASVQDQKVADTAAEGMHKIALAQCESLSGAPQKSCRDQADADYSLAKARAQLARAESDPKP